MNEEKNSENYALIPLQIRTKQVKRTRDALVEGFSDLNLNM